MSSSLPIVVTGISLLTAIVTFLAFGNGRLFERLLFSPEEIIRGRQFYRMFTSALLHSDLFHFLFNIWSFYVFGKNLELIYGGGLLLLVYVASVFGGSLLSLLIHRDEDYTAVGASGGVCGVIYASIFLIPGNSIMLFPLPIPIPDYVFAVGFLVLSSLAFERGRSRIGHDAHIGGAITGLLVALILFPGIVLARPGLLLLMLFLSVAISVFLLRGSIVSGSRRRRFSKASLPVEEPLHRCVVCHRTDRSHPELEFRVARDGNDYCLEHLPKVAPES